MKWNAPKIVELPVGMEINMYACASAVGIPDGRLRLRYFACCPIGPVQVSGGRVP
ncbi:pyrroloquinoline quinone precursor peptide PqqA [Bradyrhizobium sp. WSM 1791]|uniref:Coenzyme PQQ synthesis protein A n=1 Tax=Bradyrhizobium australiense TaxID=2721161 RepID=A0A7Y4GT35_9BRAD|nr:pyrroloquinoline quinone precursor peptide PqqA [Bradyrhizobium australiense]